MTKEETRVINAIAKLAERFGAMHFGPRIEGEVFVLEDSTVRVCLSLGMVRFDQKYFWKDLEQLRGDPYDVLEAKVSNMAREIIQHEERYRDAF